MSNRITPFDETNTCETCGRVYARGPKVDSKQWAKSRFCGRQCYVARTLANPKERFEKYVMFEPMSGCWIWTGTTTTVHEKWVYGRFSINGAGVRAHVAA